MQRDWRQKLSNLVSYLTLVLIIALFPCVVLAGHLFDLRGPEQRRLDRLEASYDSLIAEHVSSKDWLMRINRIQRDSIRELQRQINHNFLRSVRCDCDYGSRN